jgi:hypothetical protein
MAIHTKSRHRTKAGSNVFLDLGFSPEESKRLLAQADAKIDESIRLKQATKSTALESPRSCSPDSDVLD